MDANGTMLLNTMGRYSSQSVESFENDMMTLINHLNVTNGSLYTCTKSKIKYATSIAFNIEGTIPTSQVKIITSKCPKSKIVVENNRTVLLIPMKYASRYNSNNGYSVMSNDDSDVDEESEERHGNNNKQERNESGINCGMTFFELTIMCGVCYGMTSWVWNEIDNSVFFPFVSLRQE